MASPVATLSSTFGTLVNKFDSLKFDCLKVNIQTQKPSNLQTLYFSHRSFFTKLLTDNQQGTAIHTTNVEKAIATPVTLPKKSLNTAPV